MTDPKPGNNIAMLQDFLNERFDISAESATPDTPLSALGLDSMMVLDVMLEVEDRLGIKLTDMSMPRDATLADVVRLIERNDPAANA